MLPFLKSLLDEATARLPGVTSWRAFGSCGYYVDERMFALAYGRDDRLGVKLPDAAAFAAAFAAARALDRAALWAPHGSPMSGWVLLPAELHDDVHELARWVRRAFDLVRAAPASALQKSASAKKATAKKATATMATTTKPTTKKPTTKKPTTTKPTTKKPTTTKPTTKKPTTKKPTTQKTVLVRQGP